MGANLIDSTRNPKKHQASEDVLDAFSGPPKKQCDPAHIRLKGTGWAIAQRVFNPSDVWPTEDANAFMAKNLTLVPEQKQELESNLVMESFLKGYEKVPGYKASFKFKNNMFASMRSQQTAF